MRLTSHLLKKANPNTAQMVQDARNFFEVLGETGYSAGIRVFGSTCRIQVDFWDKPTGINMPCVILFQLLDTRNADILLTVLPPPNTQKDLSEIDKDLSEIVEDWATVNDYQAHYMGYIKHVSLEY